MLKKRIISALCALLSLALLLPLAACSQESRTQLVIWVYSQEYADAIEYITENSGQDLAWEPKCVVVGSAEIASRLEDVRGSDDEPDILMLSPNNLGEYVNSGKLMNIDELIPNLSESDYYTYTLDMARSTSGSLEALCWNADPGLFVYRRSMAKVYLGTDEPEAVGSMVRDWDTFLDTAMLISIASEGKTAIIAGEDEAARAYLGGNYAWIESGNAQISEAAGDYLEYARQLSERSLTAGAQQWSPAWSAGMSDTQAVFGYFSSGLGIEHILKAACAGNSQGEGSFGDWAAVLPPTGYNWGGVWLAAMGSTDKTEQCAQLIELMCCDDEAVRRYALYSGQFPAKKWVVKDIMNDAQFSSSFLGSQNYYKLLDEAAQIIVPYSSTPYDSAVESAYIDLLVQYASGQMTREEALNLLESSLATIAQSK